MKKIVIIILLILPFVLSIMISLTGKIISLTSYIAVEAISFVDEYDADIENTITVKVGEEYTPKVKVYPTLATNQKYTLQLDEQYLAFCTLSNGVITGLAHGFAELVVVSDYSDNIVDRITLKISDEDVREITLTESELTLSVGDSYKLRPTVLPSTAINKALTYTSTNPECVSVDANGNITVLKYSEQFVEILVTSVSNPEVEPAKCKINVTQNASMLKFITPNNSGVYQLAGYTLNLLDILQYNQDVVNLSEVSFIVDKAEAVVEGTTLTINASGMGAVRVTAKWGNYETVVIVFYGLTQI